MAIDMISEKGCERSNELIEIPRASVTTAKNHVRKTTSALNRINTTINVTAIIMAIEIEITVQSGFIS